MTTRFFNSLQARVTLAFLLASLLPLGIVVAFTLRTADEVITGIVTSELENVAAEKQELLQRWLGERNADLAVMAGSAAVGSMDAAQIEPYLSLVREKYGVYDRLAVADPTGRPVYDTAEDVSESLEDEVWFRQALELGAYMSEVRLGPNGRDSVFQLSTLIPGKDGEHAGVLCATVGTRTILSRVLSVSLGVSGECYLVDQAGTFLAHKEPKRILKENIARSESFTFALESRRPRTAYTDYRGIEVLGASRNVAGTQWYVVVEQDWEEASAGVFRLRHRIYLVIAATVVGVIGLSWLSAYYVSAPIRALSRAADGVARGDYEDAFKDVRISRRDEIGALYAAFRNMADQLKERQAKLETRMGLTEAELHKVEAELKGTLEAAARSERLAAVGRLAAGVAHEIRTPLTSLKLFLQSVQEEVAVSPEQREDYQIAMRQVGRIETTINHFLDFARPQQPVFGSLDIVALIDDALEVVQPRANQQDVQVHKRIAQSLPPVEGDSRQLGEALVNLMVNALEAMPDGGGLTISVESQATGADSAQPVWLRIAVSDTGTGIRDEDLQRLFEPFFTTKATGSGLGLTILRGTIERHGGSVNVDSRVGAGTTFSLRLPASSANRTTASE